MTDLATQCSGVPNVPNVPGVPAMGACEVERVRGLEGKLAQMPQVALPTGHLLHAGMYARTVRIPAGTVITGALIKRATVLVVQGDCAVYTGGDVLELQGYHVLPAQAHRKQVILARADTHLTMLFPSKASTVQAAEAEFTDEAHLLLSRREPQQDSITITGG